MFLLFMQLDDCVLCKICKQWGVKKNKTCDQLELPIDRSQANITMVGPSSTTSSDHLPAHDAMEYEPYSNHEVQKHGSSDSMQEEEEEEEDDGWLIIRVENLNISDPMIG